MKKTKKREETCDTQRWTISISTLKITYSLIHFYKIFPYKFCDQKLMAKMAKELRSLKRINLPKYKGTFYAYVNN